MRKSKTIEHVSLDGVMQQENSEGFSYGEWMMPYRTPEGLESVLEAQGRRFDLLGRRTYDTWSAFWPKAGDSQKRTARTAATKYVANHRPESPEWDTVKALGTDILKSIRELKSTDSPDLVLWRSSTLSSKLLELEEGLVDELVLIRTPCSWAKANAFFWTAAPTANLLSWPQRQRPRAC